MAAPVLHEQIIMKIGLSKVPQELKDDQQTEQSGPGQDASNPKQSQTKDFGIPEKNGKNQRNDKDITINSDHIV
jgi:hypothetical protein